MSWIAGVFDPRDRLDRSRLAELSRAAGGALVGRGPLQVALDRPWLARKGPLCLINGRIDNALAIASELECEPSSLEELLTMGYRRWGPELLPRLRGDFGLLLWDGQREEGLIARDQLGVESVFVREAPGGLCFASEIHHLLGLLPTRPAPDPVGVAHWLAVSGREGTQTLYAGVRRLRPGAMLILDRSKAWEEQYWSPRFSEPLAAPAEDLRERVRDALDLAVARRIDEQAPTGVLMSGGLDSASVAGLAAHVAPGRVRAYSGVFPDHPVVDETDLIAELRERLRLTGVTAEVRSGGLLASALESQAACELPLVAWGDFWTLPLLRRAASEGIGVTLGGDGGDELFGARTYLLADRARAGRLLQAYRLARELPGAGDKPARREVAGVLVELALGGALPAGLHGLPGWGGPDAPSWLRDPATRDLEASQRPSAWKLLNGPRWWAHLAHGLTSGVEQTGVFEHQRLRGAMAGVKARHPLFDLDLIELALRLPPESTFDRYRSRPTLRAATAGLLPDSVRLRPAKAWFDSLIIDCLGGPDRAAVMRLLDSSDSEVRAYVDPDELRRSLLDVDPYASTERFRWMHQLWRLVTIECWLRRQADPGGTVLVSDPPPSVARVELRAANPLAENANRA
jgi:asparagine synthase (glutamine-hydrolysing)